MEVVDPDPRTVSALGVGWVSELNNPAPLPPSSPSLPHHTHNRSSCTTMSPPSGLLNAQPHSLEERRGGDNQVAGWGWLANSDPDKESLMANASHKSAHFQCPEGWIIFLSCPFPRGQRYHPPLYKVFPEVVYKAIDEVMTLILMATAICRALLMGHVSG